LTFQSKKKVFRKSYFFKTKKKTCRFAEFLHFGEFSFDITEDNSKT